MTDYISETDVASYLDGKFGKGKWRFNSEYRSPKKEDELRAEGAGTVPAGHVSAHSLGKPGASGAVDISVNGMSDAEVAKALQGGPFTKAFAEGKHGPEGSHVHADTIPALPAGFKLDGAPSVEGHGEAEPPLPEGFKLDEPRLTPRQRAERAASAAATATSAAADAKRHAGDAAAHAAEATRNAPLLDQVGDAAKVQARGLSEDVAARYKPAARQFSEDVVQPPPNSLRDAVTQGARQGMGPITLAGDLMGVYGAPIVGALDYAVGRPIEAATGIPRQVVGDVASLAIPALGEALGGAAVGGRAAAAGVAPETLRASEAARQPNSLAAITRQQKPASKDPAHADAVARLEAAGVRPAQHQRVGGQIQRLAESAKADPYVGPAIRESEKAANDSFNRALYNRVLAPTGERLPATTSIGRDGVATVESKLSAAYDRVLPHVRLTGDEALTDQLADIRGSVAKLGKPQEQQYEAILNQDVLHHFGPKGMDGKTFKSVESDLLRQSRELKGSADPNARGLGRALEDTLDALRQDMIDHSPAKYRKELQGINSSYAMFTRLQDAAARRQGGGGEITPGDLLAAVKKGDRSIRKGAFARGDALLQDFAEDADRVLSPRHTTSHTPEIQQNLNFLRGHGALGGALGGAAGWMQGGPEGALAGSALGGMADIVAARGTNALARAMLSRRAPVAAPRNYLTAANRRLTGSAPTVAAISNQGQQ